MRIALCLIRLALSECHDGARRQCAESMPARGELDDLVCPAASRDELAASQQRFGHGGQCFCEPDALRCGHCNSHFARFFGCRRVASDQRHGGAEYVDRVFMEPAHGGTCRDGGLSRSVCFLVLTLRGFPMPYAEEGDQRQHVLARRSRFFESRLQDGCPSGQLTLEPQGDAQPDSAVP